MPKMAPPLAVFLTLFYCIPRISGSVRAKRVSTSDVDPPFRINHTVNGNPSHTFLSATSPGFFLNLQISRHTSLVKFYGHKCSGASLYGVHLACSSESFEIADGYDPSIPTRLDTQPSCIFSLSIDPRENVSLELYNLYDRRFGEYGTVTFSFAEYIPQDEVTAAGSSVHDQICGHHLDFSNNTSTLLPRDGGESSSTSLSQPDSVMSGKLNIVIGLLTALIVIFLAIVVVVTIYVLRLRRQAVLDRFKKDPKVKSGKNQNDTADAFLESTTATETLQVRSQDQGGTSSKNRYLEDHQPSVYTNPTSSLSTQVETDKPVSPSRPQFRNKPPTSPPREPVPEVPKVPFPLPTIQCKGNEINCSSSGSATYPDSGMTVSQARPAEPRNPENLMDQRAGSIRPAQTKIPHSRFSKPLPGILSDIPLPSPSHNNRPIAHFPESSRSSNDLPRYIDPKGRQAEVRDQTTTTRVGLDSSNQISMHSKLEHIKTPEEARQGARSLHQDLSRTRVEYETPIKVSGDSRWKDTDTTNLQDRKKLKQDTQRTRVHESPPQHDAIEIAELSLQLPADPEAWLNLLWEQERLAEPVKNNDRSQLEVLQITRPPVSPADASLRASRRSARIEPNQQDAGESKPTVTLTQYHRHEETTTQPKQEDARIPIHSPPRALPRPPF